MTIYKDEGYILNGVTKEDLLRKIMASNKFIPYSSKLEVTFKPSRSVMSVVFLL